MTNYKLSLDVWRQTPEISITALQGEINSRFLDITLTDSGQYFNLSQKTVMVYMTKPDGKIVYNTCQVTDAANGRVRVALTSQMSAAAGNVKNFEIHIIGTDKSRLKVSGICLKIKSAANTDEAIESTNEFAVLTQKISEANIAIQNANQAAQTASTTAAATATNVVNNLKAKANGLATLNASGKLVQMPTVDDIGVSNIFLAVHPIGSIFMTTIVTNPGILFGGTWVAWGSGRVPVGVDRGNIDFNTVNKTGGSSKHQHDFKMRMHWFYGNAVGEASPDGGAYRYSDGQFAGWSTTSEDVASTVLVNANNAERSVSLESIPQTTQGDTSYASTMPPYITCYMWRRTA